MAAGVSKGDSRADEIQELGERVATEVMQWGEHTLMQAVWLVTTGDGMLAVIEKMQKLGWRYYLGDIADVHRAIFHRINNIGRDTVDGVKAASTAPAAIALAALAAIGGGEI